MLRDKKSIMQVEMFGWDRRRFPGNVVATLLDTLLTRCRAYTGFVLHDLTVHGVVISIHLVEQSSKNHGIILCSNMWSTHDQSLYIVDRHVCAIAAHNGASTSVRL